MRKTKNKLPEKNAKLVQNFSPKNNKQQAFMDLIDSKEVILATGIPGSGKAQPLYSKIYTPYGPTTMGELEIGQEVCTPDGGIAKITNIYPQGVKDCYRVYFTDRTSVDCCGEHLWQVETVLDRNYNQKYSQHRKSILQTKEMIGSIITGSDKRKNYKIPITKPVFYNKKDLPLDPYLIGVLIGDGGMTSGNTVLSSKDDEIINSINNIVEQYELYLKPTKSTLEDKDCSYLIAIKDRTGKSENFVTKQTGILGIRCKSEYKSIPNIYLYSSIEDRIALLQGLMDTDGTVAKDSGCP